MPPEVPKNSEAAGSSIVQIYCPNCALEISIDEELLGDKGQCPRCSHKFVIAPEHRQPPDVDDLGTAPTIKIVMDEPFDFDLGEPDKPWVGSASFWSALTGGLALVVAALVAGGLHIAGVVPDAHGPGRFPATLAHPLNLVGMGSLLGAMMLEIFCRAERFQYLQVAVSFHLALTVVVLTVASISVALAAGQLGAMTGMALFAQLMITLAMALSFHVGERPESDRTALHIAMALGFGGLLVVAHLGKSLP